MTASKYNKEEVSNQALAATKWSYVSKYMPAGAGLLSQVFLARLLSTSDYGIVGVSLSIVAIAGILQGSRGITSATIQTRIIDEGQYGNANTMNLLLGTTLYVCLALVSPLVARYTHDSHIGWVILVQGLCIPLSSASSIYIAKLQREFHFRRIAIRTIPQSISPFLIGLPLAYYGFGYWSLVVTPIASELASLFLLRRMTNWRPLLRLDRQAALRIYHFSKWLVVDDVCVWVINSADTLIVANYFTIQQVGVYFFAKKAITIALDNLVAPVNAIVYSVFCRMDENAEDLQAAFLTVTTLMGFFVLPVMACIALSAPYLVPILFGDKWAGAGTIISFYTVGELSYVVAPSVILAQAKGRPSISAKLNVGLSLAFTASYLVAAQFGFFWFAAARLVGCSAIFIWIAITVKLLGIKKGYFYASMKAPVTSTAVMSLILYLSLPLSRHSGFGTAGEVAMIVFMLATGLVLYTALMMIRDKRTVYQAMGFVAGAARGQS